MKTNNENKSHSRPGMLFVFFLFLAIVLVYEIWQRQFAVLSYFVLVVLSPMLVLWISDLMQNRAMSDKTSA